DQELDAGAVQRRARIAHRQVGAIRAGQAAEAGNGVEATSGEADQPPFRGGRRRGGGEGYRAAALLRSWISDVDLVHRAGGIVRIVVGDGVDVALVGGGAHGRVAARPLVT